MQKVPNSLQIVLATYNGAAYLAQQMDSLLNQTLKCQILCHDDGSSDETALLLKDFALRENAVSVFPSIPQGGSKQNFSYLLEKSTADYVFCADQDDIWHPDKVEKLLKKMKFYESVYGKDQPLLIHSDLELIDEQGHLIDNSFWHYQHLDPSWGDKFNLLLTQNVVTGCAMLVNRALLVKALPIPQDAIMHDWWLALVACAFGKVEWVETPTVFYRQHQTNAVGAKSFDLSYLIQKGFSFYDSRLRRSSQAACAAQAAVFARRFPGIPAAKVAGTFARLESIPLPLRRNVIRQEEFYKIGFFRNFAWLWLF